jgi:hypothetical protein
LDATGSSDADIIMTDHAQAAVPSIWHNQYRITLATPRESTAARDYLCRGRLDFRPSPPGMVGVNIMPLQESAWRHQDEAPEFATVFRHDRALRDCSR